jgi:coproporphyrinogen III oxidase
MFREKVTEIYQTIQDEICAALEITDGTGKFEQELWEREGGGGGRTRIMQNGNVIEKGGVNFSAVHGKLPDSIKKAFNVETDEFFATGISIVMHPENPFVPIIHLNIRYFELDESTRWFGGGIDLTPHYVIDTDARFFHHHIKEVCDQFNNFMRALKSSLMIIFSLSTGKRPVVLAASFMTVCVPRIPIWNLATF